jgi:hypothetical protein
MSALRAACVDAVGVRTEAKAGGIEAPRWGCERFLNGLAAAVIPA